LSGLSVPFATAVYDNYLQDILPTLTPIQRDNIRHIYSNLKVLDAITSNLEDNYKRDKETNFYVNVVHVYMGKVEEITANYKVLKTLIKKYQDNAPCD